MLFSEIYGSYFNVVAAVLSEAAENTLTTGKLTAIVQEKAFAERQLPIRKHREERENGIASAVPFSHFSIDAVTFDISKDPIPL